MSPSKGVPTFSLVLENQQIVLRTLTQPSSTKQFASRRKRSMKKGGGSYMYIHQYYRSGEERKLMLKTYMSFKKVDFIINFVMLKLIKVGCQREV